MPNGQTFVLKQLPLYPVGVEPTVEFRVVAHLQREGVSVALPVVTDDGAIVASIEGRSWELLPYLPSRSSDHDRDPDAPAVAFAVGVGIGTLDKGLAGYPSPVKSYVDEPGVVLGGGLEQLPVDLARVVAPLSDRLVDLCADLPMQLTHGDCHDGNVLVDAARRVSIIDIDHLPTGPRVRDLSYYLGSRLRRQLGDCVAGRSGSVPVTRVFHRYIEGYQEAYPLTSGELAAVVPLMVLIEIGRALWALNGWSPSFDSYQRRIGSVSWLCDHYDALVHAASIS